MENKIKFHVFSDERFVDLNIYQYGWEKCSPLHSFGPFIRKHFLFHFVISGKGVLMANDKTYEVTAGQGFLICPGQTTTYYADEQSPWEYSWVEFDGLRVNETLVSAGISPNHPIYYPENKKKADIIIDAMMYIVNNPDLSPTRLIGHAFIFLDQLVQCSKTKLVNKGKRLRDFYMKEALSYIEQNYMHDISVEDIAKTCGLNRSYFSKIFKDTMGKSTMEFLVSYRLSKAAQLLKETNLNVGEIGQMVGYPNPLHFSRAFKGIYGISPKKYHLKHFLTSI